MGFDGTIRFELMPPEPGRLWIRFAPRRWPGPSGWWIDLARAEPATEALRSATAPGRVTLDFDDVVYLPPLEHEGELLRQEIVHKCGALGVPVVQQILPGQPAPVGEGLLVVDLTEALLRRRLSGLAIPSGAWVAWPLIPGLTDGDEIRSQGLELVTGFGVAGVLPIAVALSPQERRRLAEFGSAASYTELFHGDQAGSFREFASEVGAAGLGVFPPRPELAAGRRRPNRSLATHFSMLAELWLGCDRPPGRAQIFFDIARRLELERADVSELARRGGLASIDWLDSESREEVRAVASGRETRLLEELDAEFFGRDGR